MSFAGKVIIVTGAFTGVGAGAAVHLAGLGANVTIVGTDQRLLTEVSSEIKRNNASAKVLVMIAGITKDDAERIIHGTVAYFGKLDILITTGGAYKDDSVNNFDVKLFDEIMNTNLKFVAMLTSLAVPHLEKTKGNIVNVSSIAAMKCLRNGLSYCVSKAALDKFTKCAALDLAPKGIRVNLINPSVIRTSALEESGENAADAEEFWMSGNSMHPIGRIGVVSDTSSAIEYLAGDNASFITGASLVVDGGYSLK